MVILRLLIFDENLSSIGLATRIGIPFRLLDNYLLRQPISGANILENGSYNTDLIAKGRCIRAAEEGKENALNAISLYNQLHAFMSGKLEISIQRTAIWRLHSIL